MIANWMLFSVAVGIAMALAAAGVERACRVSRVPARFVWMGAVAVSVAWPALALLFRRPVPMSPAVVASGAPISLDVSRLVAGGSAPGAHAGMLHLVNSALAAGWIAASALLLAGMIVAMIRISRRRATWRRETVDGVPIRISADIGPAVVGVRAAEIVLPEWTLALDAPLRQLVLRHEVEHRDAGDPRLLFAAAALVALFPWNVALWLQARRLRLAVEMDCDERVLARHDEPDRYGRLLITIAQRKSNLLPPLAPTLSEPVSHLERRIRAMTNIPGRFKRVRVVAFLLAAMAAVVAACAVRTPDQLAGPAQSPADRAAMAANPNTTFYSYQVDQQAKLTPGDSAPVYPADLRSANVQGEVIAQFVVDASGRVDTSTFKVLRSSHALFTQAVKQAVAGWTFSPAEVQGHAAKQLVQQPFSFMLNGGPGGAANSETGGGITQAPATNEPATSPAGNGSIAFKVDSAARLLPGNGAPRYPDLLRSANVSGQVAVQFVVSPTGRDDPSTIRVVQSSHTLFAQSVRAAAAARTFRPAFAGGHAVKELVQIPVLFSIDAPTAPVTPGTIVVRPIAQ